MSQPNNHHFHLGKEARKNGKSCIVTDARVSPANREQFYAGWAHQDNLMKPPPTDEEIAQNEGFFADLKEDLRATSAVKCFRYFCRRCQSLHHLDMENCPSAPECCRERMAYRGHSTAVPGKLLKGQYLEADV